MMDALISWTPQTWVDYLLLYIVPGFGMAIYFIAKAMRERPSEFARGLLNVLGKKLTLVDRIKDGAVYCFALACVLVGWPGFVIWYFMNKKAEVARQEFEDRPEFDCAPEHLVAVVNPVDAEITSYVIDPLGKVPALPFGHLNTAWGNFLANMLDEQDELWSFYIPMGSKVGKYQRICRAEIRGYAQVRDGKILAEFMTESD